MAGEQRLFRGARGLHGGFRWFGEFVVGFGVERLGG